ncbi:MAG: DNA gyrase inhibitor YacG [Beijerinckiaceae bacterium]|jgi:endogenous inhibitor of DNA gyrase (YacG/DUF329 family)
MPSEASFSLRNKQAPACPLCGKPADAHYRPFCSKRCADIDLNRWLGGVYAIPSAGTDEDEDEDGEEPQQASEG